MKKVLGVHGNPNGHWVGDGFPVRSLFFYQNFGKQLSPFLMLDYAGPTKFEPTTTQRGVGQHPHRGFETVTIVYKGEVAHHDSTGSGGTIGPGDVQWMTAASGILHQEFHSEEFAKSGGILEMVQLWVNLPSKDKMTKPGYQAILSADIPTVQLPQSAGSSRLIAGHYQGQSGPAHTFTPMNVWDLSLKQGASFDLPAPESWNTALIVLHGSIRVNHEVHAEEAQMVLLSGEGTDLHVEVETDAIVLFLSGQPIDEPIVGYGPFVMNTKEEIDQAIQDFNSGNFGRIHV